MSEGALGLTIPVERFFWLEARLLARLGKVTMARDRLELARALYLDGHQLPEAVLVTLELIALRGRRSRIASLIQSLQEHFAGAPGLEEILEVLRRLAGAKLSPADLPRAAGALRQLILDHGHRFEPLPFA